MKRTTASVILFLALLTGALNAQDKVINTDNEYRDPWIEAYAGLGYYCWDLSYLSGGNLFDNDIDPFILKKFELRGNLRLLKLGLNYFTSRFDDMFNTTDEADVAKENDPLARQLAMLAGIELGPVVISADAKFRKFQGTITSNGKDLSGGGSVESIVYTSSGPEYLAKGDRLTWYSMVRDYTLKVGTPWRRKTGFNFAMEFGARMVEYASPVMIDVAEHIGTGSGHTTGLFVSDITQYFIGFSFWMNYTWANGFYWDWALPAYLGANRLENPYLDMGPGNTYTFSSSGKLASGYRTGNVRFELGFDYDFFISNSMYTSRLKRNVAYYTPLGDPAIMSAGAQVDSEFVRMEIFWGIYLHATVMF